eukprot:1203803-Amorphochlora_amoeboformis.AAC.1
MSQPSQMSITPGHICVERCCSRGCQAKGSPKLSVQSHTGHSHYAMIFSSPIQDAQEVGRGGYAYALLASAAGLADPFSRETITRQVVGESHRHRPDGHPPQHSPSTLDNTKCVIAEYCAKGRLSLPHL